MTLDEYQTEVLESIAEGADVFSPLAAKFLRQYKREHPDWVNICEPMGDYDGVGVMPYFGAILTAAGMAAMKEKPNCEA